MRYGTQKPTGPWRITFTVRHEPRCPGCAEFLQSVIVEFRGGWAWCPVCVGHGLHLQPHLSHVLGLDEVCKCSTVINGLRFYTPDPIDGTARTLYEWFERIVPPVPLPVVPDDPGGLYALTPSGEHVLADLDVSELAEVERDLKRVRAGRN